jgi:hypothetical protein
VWISTVSLRLCRIAEKYRIYVHLPQTVGRSIPLYRKPLWIGWRQNAKNSRDKIKIPHTFSLGRGGIKIVERYKYIHIFIVLWIYIKVNHLQKPHLNYPVDKASGVAPARFAKGRTIA